MFETDPCRFSDTSVFCVVLSSFALYFWLLDSCLLVASVHKLESVQFFKVALIQKGLVDLSFLQVDEPNYFPELKF